MGTEWQPPGQHLLASAGCEVAHYRIDEHHGNACATWKRMGSPIAPDRDQYAALEKASALALLDSPATVRVERGAVTLRFLLPRQAVSLVTIEVAVVEGGQKPSLR